MISFSKVMLWYLNDCFKNYNTKVSVGNYGTGNILIIVVKKFLYLGKSLRISSLIHPLWFIETQNVLINSIQHFIFFGGLGQAIPVSCPTHLDRINYVDMYVSWTNLSRVF